MRIVMNTAEVSVREADSLTLCPDRKGRRVSPVFYGRSQKCWSHRYEETRSVQKRHGIPLRGAFEKRLCRSQEQADQLSTGLRQGGMAG